MAHRLIAVLGVLATLILTGAQRAEACEECRLSGFVCNAYDDCSEVVACQDVQMGRGGYNDCYTDSYGGCNIDGGPCMWASWIVPAGKNPIWTPTCHETKS
jgi:hypothetical protein